MKKYLTIFLIFGWIILVQISNSSAMEVWVANTGDDTVSIIKNKKVETISCGKGPREIIILPKKQLVYVNECGQHSLAIYSLKTKKFLKRIKLDYEGRGLTLTPDETLLYFVLKDKNELIEWDIAQNKILRRVNTPRGPRNIALDIKNKRIFITCNIDNLVAIYDINSFQKKTEIKTAKQPYSLKIKKDILFVSSIGENLIQSFFIQNHKINWEATCVKHPTSIEFDETGNILVTNFDSDQLIILSVVNGKVLSTILTGHKPFNLQVISNQYVVSNFGDNTLNLYSNSNIIETYRVGKEPHGFSVTHNGETK